MRRENDKGSRRSRARWAWSGGVAVAATLATVGATTSAVSAQPGNDQHPAFTKVDLSGHGADGLHYTPAAASNRIVSVMLQMQQQPVTVQAAAAEKQGKKLSRKDQKAIGAQLASDQDQIKPGIARAGGRVVAQLQWVYNGVQVHVPQKDVAKLAALPGVVAVHAVQTFKPANTNGVPYVGAPRAWEDAGETGKGVKVAVIDTGVDYTHADFGGPGTVEAFKAAQATSTEPLPEDSGLFGPNAPKVKGGYDFVGDDYNANTPGSVPQPDPNPLDCNGHGTHTAGTAAGFGVDSNGATYQGPYKANTISSQKWDVGPGVAPEADIYAYRVFGCEGSSDVVAAAIDKAVEDGADVISMSLGSDFGGTDDPTTVAAENAALNGVAVVAAAGNAGNNAYMVSSPGAGDHVLSVAAIDGSLATYPGARLSFVTKDGADGGSVDTIDANGAELPTDPMTVKVLRNADDSVSLGCDPQDYKDVVAGDLVVTARGSCARVARAVYGQQAGASAVVMINSGGSLPPYEGPITSNPDTGEQYPVTIPFLGAKGPVAKDPAATGTDAQALIAADGDQVTLSSISVPNSTYSKTADFSSGGPRNPDSAPKPEVTAPGVSVASAGVGTGNGYVIESGTSMATPMTAGTAALVKQAHPSWSGDEIKAAIQNTGDPSLNGGYNGRLAGTGVVQAQKAVDSTVLAQTSDGLNSLAFGFVPGSGTYRATKHFTLTNTGDSAATYNLAAETNGDQLGAAVTVNPSSVTIAPGATKTVNVTLSMSKDAFAKLPSDDTSVVGPGGVISVRGAVVATPVNPNAGQQNLRMAYLVVPRGLSDVRAGTPSVFTSTGSDSSTFGATLPVRNVGIHAGTADLFAWGISDGKDNGGLSMDVRDAGVQVQPAAAPDTERALVFAVNNWGQATNQATNEFDVAIDNNGDGKADFYVVGVDLGAVTSGVFNGQLASFTIDAATNEVVDGFYADAPMNGSVVELPAFAGEVGVDSAHPAFSYSVTGSSVLDGSLVDQTGTASFDAFTPAVDSGQYAEVDPGQSVGVPVTVDQDLAKSSKARGWLVVSVDDASGASQADEVPLPATLGRGNGRR